MQRRKIIPEPSFQINFALTFIVSLVLMLGVLTAVASGSLFIIAKNPNIDAAQAGILRTGAIGLVWFGLILVLIFAGIFGYLGLNMSFRMVGPLARIEIWLESVIHQGNTQPLKVRPTDDLYPIVSVLNRLVTQIKNSKSKRVA